MYSKCRKGKTKKNVVIYCGLRNLVICFLYNYSMMCGLHSEPKQFTKIGQVQSVDEQFEFNLLLCCLTVLMYFALLC